MNTTLSHHTDHEQAEIDLLKNLHVSRAIALRRA